MRPAGHSEIAGDLLPPKNVLYNGQWPDKNVLKSRHARQEWLPESGIFDWFAMVYENDLFHTGKRGSPAALSRIQWQVKIL